MRLDAMVTDRLVQNSILTAQDVIECPILNLMEAADLSYSAAVSLVSFVGAKLVIPQTALEMLESSTSSEISQFVPSGVVGSFTDSMGGGFVKQTISEICGPPGIGKTQMCLGCCADVLVQHHFGSGRDGQKKTGGVVYYDTELKFSPQRLLEITLARYPDTSQRSLSAPESSVAEELLLRVSVRRPMSCKELNDDLLTLESFIITEGISLVSEAPSPSSSLVLAGSQKFRLDVM
jgi:hypothetical protein